MSLQALLVHDVTVLTAGTTTGRYGDTVKDWSTATRTRVKAWITRRTQTENGDHREAQISEWKMFVTPDVAISGADRVEWGTTTFEVDGPPLPAWTPRGEHHLEVPLRVVTG